MIDAAEEARARLYREQQTRRVQFQLEQWYALAGSPAAREALAKAWQPVTDWLAEREMPPIDSEDELDPIGISDTVNVGL